ADRHGLTLIEDACEALGAEYRGAPLGSHGPSCVFAFYPNKQITTGEGGIVTTHSEEEWRLVRSLRNQGRSDAGGWLEHVRLGFNYRIDDIRAAIGIGQLERLNELLALRAQVAQRYHELLRGLDAVEPLCPDDADHRRSWFVYVVRLPDRDTRERYGFREGMCPVSEETSERTLALPFFTALELDAQERVVEVLASAL